MSLHKRASRQPNSGTRRDGGGGRNVRNEPPALMTLCKVVYQRAGGDKTAARRRSLWPLEREELLWEVCIKSQEDGEAFKSVIIMCSSAL